MGIRDRFGIDRRKRAVSPASSAARKEFVGGSRVIRSVLWDDDQPSKFVNIAFCGAKDTGKSSLINGVCNLHLAGGRSARADGDRFRHPNSEDVVFHELPLAAAVRKDFKGFSLVVIVFEASIKDVRQKIVVAKDLPQTDMEVAKRASEMKVPVIFVHTKADLALRRIMQFEGYTDTKHGIKQTRARVNEKPDMRWFQMKEVDRKVRNE